MLLIGPISLHEGDILGVRYCNFKGGMAQNCGWCAPRVPISNYQTSTINKLLGNIENLNKINRWI